ncbi:MAG TPA: hypothetical protein VIH90_02845 [Candidatus Saccharimonadales bacterium]
MKLNQSKIIFLAVIFVAVIGVAVLGVYLHRSQWLFTPAYSQRQTATKFLDDVYANKMSAAYGLTSNKFLSTNSIVSFSSSESPLVGNHMITHFGKYYVVKGQSIITGSILNASNGTVITLNMTFAGNKLDSFNAVQAN